jgi:hypothetical protein
VRATWDHLDDLLRWQVLGSRDPRGDGVGAVIGDDRRLADSKPMFHSFEQFPHRFAANGNLNLSGSVPVIARVGLACFVVDVNRHVLGVVVATITEGATVDVCVPRVGTLCAARGMSGELVDGSQLIGMRLARDGRSASEGYLTEGRHLGSRCSRLVCRYIEHVCVRGGRALAVVVEEHFCERV